MLHRDMNGTGLIGKTAMMIIRIVIATGTVQRLAF